MSDTQFELNMLPEGPEGLGVDRRSKCLPPVLKTLLNDCAPDGYSFGRVNVTGDGHCGLYVQQLLWYLTTGDVMSLDDLLEHRIRMIERVESLTIEEKVKLKFAEPHFQEYIEMGLCLSVLPFNFAVIVQTNMKKSGQKRRRTYPLRVVNYDPTCNVWAIALLNGQHYELLTLYKKKRHSHLISEEVMRKIFTSCGESWPDNKVLAEDQVCYLNVDDFIYF